MIKIFKNIKLLYYKIKKKYVKVKPLTVKEQNIVDILKKFLRADEKEIHCDSTNEKYSVKHDNVTIAINGSNEKVYIMVEDIECGDKVINIDLGSSFVSILINLIVVEKSRLSDLIYEKMSNSVEVFLTELNKEV